MSHVLFQSPVCRKVQRAKLPFRKGGIAKEPPLVVKAAPLALVGGESGEGLEGLVAVEREQLVVVVDVGKVYLSVVVVTLEVDCGVTQKLVCLEDGHV